MKEELTRRKFVKHTAMASAGTVCLGLVVTSCAPYAYGTHIVEKDRIRIPKAEFGKKRFLIIKPAGLRTSVLLSKLSENNFSALLMECTHKQCTVNPTGEKLICPCHGSEFDLEGNVVKSPAEKPLTSFKVTQDESNLFVY